MQRTYVVPRYDPVFVEPNNLKEYETQVLQMSVPLDDNESYNDLQLDFSSKNHAFSMENVSYITKESNHSGGESPSKPGRATDLGNQVSENGSDFVSRAESSQFRRNDHSEGFERRRRRPPQ